MTNKWKKTVWKSLREGSFAALAVAIVVTQEMLLHPSPTWHPIFLAYIPVVQILLRTLYGIVIFHKRDNELEELEEKNELN